MVCYGNAIGQTKNGLAGTNISHGGTAGKVDGDFGAGGPVTIECAVMELSLISRRRSSSVAFIAILKPAAGALALLFCMPTMVRAISGAGETVLLDAWYNSQTRRNAAGQMELFHYKWDDFSNSGYSLFAQIWRSYGVATKMLGSAPTVEKLKDAQFYIIVSPDIPSKNPEPHYMTEGDAEQIAQWVRAGGVLLMMENDPANADIPHMDLLADKFGLHFNNVLVHHVVGDDFPAGRIDVTNPSPPFTHPHVLYMKDTCSLTLSEGAIPLLKDKAGDLLMADAKYGKGMVFAVTDPWLYNEYTDGKKLPPEYDNFAAGKEFVAWLLEQRAKLPH
jgi:unsaturated rhamnogalacturonyl hydrolase